tara:strand:+ start:241 stop:507 length:267 start_codon:yes stop_codon:yes gene_type:complete
MISDAEAKKREQEYKEEISLSGNIVPKTEDQGPEDLKDMVATLEFRNKVLHNYIEVISDEINRLRIDNKRLVKQCEDQLNQFRNRGDL